MKERDSVVAAVYLILRREDGAILFSRRKGSGYCDGQLGLVSGHVDDGESIVAALIRETKEEVGIDIKARDLQFVHVRDRNAEDYHRIDFYFDCDTWDGDIRIMEENKCSELVWVSDLGRDDLIENVVEAISLSVSGENFSIENW